MMLAQRSRRRARPARPRALVAGDVFDLDFRPNSYWDDADPVAAVLRDIKGERRRQIVAGALQDGTDTVPDMLLQSALPDESRTRWGFTHPTFMGGEYLPDIERGATEIARIVLASTTMDVYSLRARRIGRGQHAGRLRFEVVDEYETAWRLKPRFADGPLSLGEIICLIDTARADEEEYIHSNYVLNICEYQWDNHRTAQAAYDATRFVSVESSIYPELGGYYEALIREWAWTKGVVWHFDGTQWVVNWKATSPDPTDNTDESDDADAADERETEPWQ